MQDYEKFQNLMVMAAADGQLTEGEIGFLSSRCARWGLSEEQFSDAIRYALADDAHMTVPARKEEGVELLRDLVRMMAADGELADIEKQLFAVAAARMDISDSELNALLDEMLRGGGPSAHR